MGPEEIVDAMNRYCRDSEQGGGGGDHLGKAGKDSKQSKKMVTTAKERMWQAKVARYLAWCVDGGLLQSKFTIQTMIGFAKSNFPDQEDEAAIQREIAYLLHLRDKDQAWQWERASKLGDAVKDINPQQQVYNPSVMVALIESGYMQGLIK